MAQDPKKTTRELKDSVGDLVNSTPLVAAARGIAKVGEKAQDLYQRGRRKLRGLTAGSGSTRATTKRRTGDIHLPGKRSQTRKR